MLDLEKFIDLVKTKPLIYNANLEDYSDRIIRRRCWQEIGKLMFEDWDNFSDDQQNEQVKALQKRWKNTRDQFTKSFKYQREGKRKSGSNRIPKYMFHEKLSFLEPFIDLSKIKPLRPTREHAVPIEEDSFSWPEEGAAAEDDAKDERAGSEEDRLAPEGENGTSDESAGAPNAKRQKRRSSDDAYLEKILEILNLNLELQRNEKVRDKMGNKSFLDSLLPILNMLDDSVNMKVRLQIMLAIDKALSS